MTGAWRGLFVVLALLVAAAQVARGAAEAGTDMAGPPPLDRAAAALGLHPAVPVLPGTLAFAAPGCGRSVTLAAVDFDGLGQTAGSAVLALPGTPRFVYLGAVSERMHVAAIAARWGVASLLHILGLRHAEVPRQLVLVMLPDSCRSLAALDWGRLSPW